jgi:hypothetical protein
MTKYYTRIKLFGLEMIPMVLWEKRQIFMMNLA